MLVVEDDPVSAHALRILMRRQGWKVDIAATIAEAHAYLDNTIPHTIILDLMLPDGDGSAVLKRVRDQALASRVTVTTATADLDWIQRVKAMKPVAVLKKPIELGELLRAIA